MTEKNDNLRNTTDELIAATNAFDVDRVLNLFTEDAVIDDPSIGLEF